MLVSADERRPRLQPRPRRTGPATAAGGPRRAGRICPDPAAQDAPQRPTAQPAADRQAGAVSHAFLAVQRALPLARPALAAAGISARNQPAVHPPAALSTG